MCRTYPVRWGADEIVSTDAMRLALALDHPVYDCVYLALAHRIGVWVRKDGQASDLSQCSNV